MKIVRADSSSIREAAHIIRGGGLVVFPTETVYGLGANALLPFAVKRIFEVKGRPSDNPLIVHVSSLEQAELLSSNLPPLFYELAENFWPGPLTLVVSRSSLVPLETTGGRDTVAIRMPNHRIALSLIEESGVPIAAPSANKSGRPSPTRISHVLEDFQEGIDIIIDGGSTFHGLESTVLSLVHDPPLVLRLGALPLEEIKMVAEVEVHPAALGKKMDAPTPGAKYTHYAPSVPLILVESGREVLFSLYDDLKRDKKVALLLLRDMNPEDVAKTLFNQLRELEKKHDIILVEPPLEKGVGLAILDRLRKAATKIVR